MRDTHFVIPMIYKDTPQPKKVRSNSSKQSHYTPGTDSGFSGGVHESASVIQGGEKVEMMLSDILIRLERIEEKIDETVYPPESAIKPEFIKRVKKAQADIAQGKGKTYKSMDDFIRAISE